MLVSIFTCRPAQTFTIKSAIPVGAGLGSSAAFSVCLASALLYTHEHLPLPVLPVVAGTLHHGRRVVAADQADVVNAWAFSAEKILHGTPSGVDNTVSALGGAIGFVKAVKGRAGGMEGLHGSVSSSPRVLAGLSFADVRNSFFSIQLQVDSLLVDRHEGAARH